MHNMMRINQRLVQNLKVKVSVKKEGMPEFSGNSNEQ